MIRSERALLSSVFRELCVLTMAAPLAMVACDESIGAVPLETLLDASTNTDATVDGATDANIEAALDASAGPCAPVPYEGDADAAIDFCANLVHLPCGVPPDVVPRDKCFFTLNDCDRFCKGAYFNCHAWDDSCVDGSIPEAGGITVDCVTCIGGAGRRPRGLEVPVARAGAEVGDVFAAMAQLEAASVHSFRMLRRDLEAFGAPPELTRAAARAMRDEARHARAMSRLSRRHHGRGLARVRVRSMPRPSLESFALENAVEGCVHETYAAMLATWQAAHSTDPEVAHVMKRIATDETDHAALAWAVARCFEPRLSDGARARVEVAVDRALLALERAGAVRGAPSAGDALGVLGLPTPPEQRRLARELRRRLWPMLSSSSSRCA